MKEQCSGCKHIEKSSASVPCFNCSRNYTDKYEPQDATPIEQDGYITVWRNNDK